jgi:hypothetical protein
LPGEVVVIAHRSPETTTALQARWSGGTASPRNEDGGRRPPSADSLDERITTVKPKQTWALEVWPI